MSTNTVSTAMQNDQFCKECGGLGRIYDHNEMYEKDCHDCSGDGLLVKGIPRVVNWPITKERYRQVLGKMHRQWEEIQNLKLENERLKEELEKLK